MRVLDALGVRRDILVRSTVYDQLARAHERHQCSVRLQDCGLVLNWARWGRGGRNNRTQGQVVVPVTGRQRRSGRESVGIIIVLVIIAVEGHESLVLRLLVLLKQEFLVSTSAREAGVQMLRIYNVRDLVVTVVTTEYSPLRLRKFSGDLGKLAGVQFREKSSLLVISIRDLILDVKEQRPLLREALPFSLFPALKAALRAWNCTSAKRNS
mmetsp:Transcript_3734/g.7536  ORF Transcript_3734/g.7536 Transcript_3734/m.7536 type:complete len:211 (+) Transcript_3734:993-1625(+)